MRLSSSSLRSFHPMPTSQERVAFAPWTVTTAGMPASSPRRSSSLCSLEYNHRRLDQARVPLSTHMHHRHQHTSRSAHLTACRNRRTWVKSQQISRRPMRIRAMAA